MQKSRQGSSKGLGIKIKVASNQETWRKLGKNICKNKRKEVGKRVKKT